MMVRMIYFLHDVDMDEGPFCVVPGTHKSNYPSPIGGDPDEEPGMVGLPVRRETPSSSPRTSATAG